MAKRKKGRVSGKKPSKLQKAYREAFAKKQKNCGTRAHNSAVSKYEDLALKKGDRTKSEINKTVRYLSSCSRKKR